MVLSPEMQFEQHSRACWVPGRPAIFVAWVERQRNPGAAPGLRRRKSQMRVRVDGAIRATPLWRSQATPHCGSWFCAYQPCCYASACRVPRYGRREMNDVLMNYAQGFLEYQVLISACLIVFVFFAVGRDISRS